MSGGKRDDWGQFIWCPIERDFDQFEFQRDAQTISEIQKLAKQTGRQEITFKEYWDRYSERERLRKEKDQ